MHRSVRPSLVCLVVCCVSLSASEKRSITEKDLFRFNWIGDPQISPDASRVAFVKVTVNGKRDGYEETLWSVSLRGDEPPRRLTNGTHDSAPRWSPDGKWLAFLRTPEDPATPPAGGAAGARPPAAQLYLLPTAGGESWRVTDLPRSAGAAAWSPDSRTIAFISTTSPEDLARQQRTRDQKQNPAGKDDVKGDRPAGAPGEPAPADAEHESDVRVITRAVYRMNGSGYLDPKHRQHIWVMTAPKTPEESVEPTQLTGGPFDEANIMWSRDARRIYFITRRVLEPYYELPHSDVYSVAADGGEPVKVLALDVEVRQPSLDPDGRRMAFCASVNKPVHSYTQPDVWVVDLAANARPRNLTPTYDFDMCGDVGGDQPTPRAAGSDEVIWTPDGHGVITTTAREGKANLVQVDIASGTVTELTRGNQAVERYRAAADGSTFVAKISTPTSIGDLFRVDRWSANPEPRRLTQVNETLFSELTLTPPEEIWYTSFDRRRVQAWIQKPPNFDPTRKYPLILDIHGGPHAAYGYVFDHEFQWMAAKGYVVLYPNPRGSTSYGQEFGNIIQYHYPGDDFRDLMIGVDEVVKRGYIDERKMGVTGGSGGGLLTNWVVGHTDRFAAAVSQRDIASWVDWWYSADFTLFEASWFKAPPFQDPQDYVNRSPITYIDKVRTPLMLVLGEADYRTPPGAGGEEMFRALKYLKRPVIMIRFPGESHELSRSGKPWHRIERLQHIVGWFDKYLMGMSKPEYDEVMGAELRSRR